jgi:putative tryptophan/tyrosine transport system substrate-binding protein
LFYGISVAEGGNAMIIKIIGLITTLVLTHVDFAAAQQPAKTPRIGFLFVGSKDQPHLESFHQGLRELGYVEGKNISIEYRYAEGKSDALPALAAELVALNVEVIVTTNPNGSRAVLRASSAIPIVVVGFDPVATGLVKSLAHPGGNITGLSSRVGPDMEGKRLDVLKEAFPKISAVAMLWNPEAGQLAHLALDSAKRGAEALDIRLRPHEVRNAGDIDRAFADLKKLRADALLIPGGVLMTLNSRRVVGLAAKHRLPAIYQTRQFVQDGGLMAYGVSFPDLYKRAAIYVDKTLKGTKPADLPVELPMKFELFINLKAAKQIGLTIPPNVLARADKVIK